MTEGNLATENVSVVCRRCEAGAGCCMSEGKLATVMSVSVVCPRCEAGAGCMGEGRLATVSVSVVCPWCEGGVEEVVAVPCLSSPPLIARVWYRALSSRDNMGEAGLALSPYGWARRPLAAAVMLSVVWIGGLNVCC